MALPRTISDLAGTALTYFKIGLSSAAVRLKAVSGGLVARNVGDSADAPITASQLRSSGNSLELNSDAAGSGADWKLTIARPASGMSADWTLTLPPNDGSPNQVLTTDGSGNTTWETPAAGSPNGELIDETALAFGDSSPVAMFNKPANNFVPKIQVFVDTVFNGTAPTLSIGISGSTSKYMGTGDIDLKTVGVYEVCPDVAPEALLEALIATYNADSSSTGAARLRVFYADPT
jgi:hypothetical protein